MPKPILVHEALTRSVIGGFYAVYNELGYGLLEAGYRNALEAELESRGHSVAREVAFIVRYKGKPIALQRIDMIIDGKLVVEIKSTEKLAQSAHRQLLSYLKASELEVGLLLHFGPEAKFHRQVLSEHHRRRARPSEKLTSD